MATDPGPFDLDDVRFVLRPDGTATTKAVGPHFYEELDREFAGFRGCTLVQRFAFREPWPTWEVHPHGDELVYLLEGATDFVLRVDDADRIVRLARPGTYVVVPRGVWHTARPHAPTVLLFFTPGEGTCNAATPPERAPG